MLPKCRCNAEAHTGIHVGLYPLYDKHIVLQRNVNSLFEVVNVKRKNPICINADIFNGEHRCWSSCVVGADDRCEGG